MKFSLFKGTHPKPLGLIDLDQLVNEIRNPDKQTLETLFKIRELTKELENLSPESEQFKNKDRTKGELKETLRSYTPGGTFHTWKKGGNLIKGSGIAILDYDHIKEPETFRDQMFEYYPFFILSFLSPSKDGVKFLVKIPIVQSPGEFKQYYSTLFDEFSVYPNLDPSNSDITRLMFTSYDTEILVRPYNKAEVWDIKATPQPVVKHTPINYDKETLSKQQLHAYNIMNRRFRNITSGERHPRVRGLAILMGGYVAAGLYSEPEAVDILINMVRANSYLNAKAYKYEATIKTAIIYGINKGATVPKSY
jgi:hypothetical protein